MKIIVKDKDKKIFKKGSNAKKKIIILHFGTIINTANNKKYINGSILGD